MTDFIAAIELGSSKIYGMVGKKQDDGSLKILAQATEDSSGFIRKGVVLNLDKTSKAIKTIVAALEKNLEPDDAIGKVYVGISGQSLHSRMNEIERHLDEETIISRQLIDEISDENRATTLLNDLEILEVEPQEYKIGINLEADPVGIAGRDIEGRFLNIIARKALKTKLESCFNMANVEIADLLVSPMKTAKVVLTDAEMRSGCALVDFGADTTTVSIYKNNILRFLTVIPLGGNSITHDITTLQMEDEEAEMLKIQYGNVMYEEEAEDGKETVIQLEDGSRIIELQKLNDIVEARAEEIIANVWNQIELSGYDDKIRSGFVITGGGTNLRKLNEFIHKKTNQKVRVARFIRNEVQLEGTVVMEKDGTENTILGLLTEGTENCRKAKEPEKPVTIEQPTTPTDLFGAQIKETAEVKKDPPKPKKPKKNWFKTTVEKISNVSNDLFSDEEM